MRVLQKQEKAESFICCARTNHSAIVITNPIGRISALGPTLMQMNMPPIMGDCLAANIRRELSAQHRCTAIAVTLGDDVRDGSYYVASSITVMNLLCDNAG